MTDTSAEGMNADAHDELVGSLTEAAYKPIDPAIARTLMLAAAQAITAARAERDEARKLYAKQTQLAQLMNDAAEEAERDLHACEAKLAGAYEVLEGLTQIIQGDMDIEPLAISDNPLESALGKAVDLLSQRAGNRG
jgi:hypothetical protein